ncbi:MAG TPA: hypothetical protein DCF68_08645 [Cyanothece sp. UBA12306]|nr:hypothetical protein [Cyanothece sp. UBA12306]
MKQRLLTKKLLKIFGGLLTAGSWLITMGITPIVQAATGTYCRVFISSVSELLINNLIKVYQ